jgi:hypothetical protein
MTLTDLLKIPATFPQPGEAPPPTIGERLAELVYRNGGRIEITSWGVIEFGGLYGEMGLHQNEALELLYLSGLIRGFGLASDMAGAEKAVIEWIQAEWKRVEGTLIQRETE